MGLAAKAKKTYVVLVNRAGRKTGLAEKLRAHQLGLLHRAFSIFLFNTRGEMLLQRRADSKYHFAGLWSNTCCSHPKPGEKIISAAHRRLLEELGLDAPLKMYWRLIYRFEDGKSKLTEHEFDYLLIGRYDGPIKRNAEEVGSVRWVTPKNLYAEIRRNPARFTPWFKMILDGAKMRKMDMRRINAAIG